MSRRILPDDPSPSEPIASHPTEPDAIAPEPRVSYNEKTNIVTVTTSFGKLLVSEPRAKHILLTEGGLTALGAEYCTDSMTAIYLVYRCSDADHPTFDDFLDALEIEDIEVIGEALAIFRNRGCAVLGAKTNRSAGDSV